MKSRLPTLLLILAAGVGSFLAVRYFRSQPVLAGERKAFFVQMHGKAGLVDDPAKFHERYFFYAVRSDGSYVRGNYRELPDRTMMILDRGLTLVPERKMIGVTERTRLKTTYPLKQEQIVTPYARFTDPTCAVNPLDARQFQAVGEDTILGFKVFRLRELVNGVEQFWRAPDLDCYALRARFEFRGTDGQVTDYSEENAVSVSVGEPPGFLFQVPDDYLEKIPSQHHQDNLAAWAASQQPPAAVPEVPEQRQHLLELKDQQYKEAWATAPK